MYKMIGVPFLQCFITELWDISLKQSFTDKGNLLDGGQQKNKLEFKGMNFFSCRLSNINSKVLLTV